MENPIRVRTARRNQREATVRGVHFIQEASPQPIAAVIVDWLAALA